jgi:hypothetical protein
MPIEHATVDPVFVPHAPLNSVLACSRLRAAMSEKR